jgi:hypothetical protein
MKSTLFLPQKQRRFISAFASMLLIAAILGIICNCVTPLAAYASGSGGDDSPSYSSCDSTSNDATSCDSTTSDDDNSSSPFCDAQGNDSSLPPCDSDQIDSPTTSNTGSPGSNDVWVQPCQYVCKIQTHLYYMSPQAIQIVNDIMNAKKWVDTLRNFQDAVKGAQFIWHLVKTGELVLDVAEVGWSLLFFAAHFLISHEVDHLNSLSQSCPDANGEGEGVYVDTSGFPRIETVCTV